MKTIEIIGYQRANLGKSDAQKSEKKAMFHAYCTEAMSKCIFIPR